MFTSADKGDLNQVSLTGMRAIILLGLLMVEPRSLDEIRKAFLSYKVIDDSHSNDILRIDINTLKHMGCEISRASHKTDFKYVLGENPFSLNITDEDLKVLKKVYSFVKEKADINELISYHNLFEKIANHVSNKRKKEEIKGISVLKYYDINTIHDLQIDCSQERILILDYQNPTTGNVTQKEIVSQKLVFKNDKLYLFGYDTDKKEQVTLNAGRIKKINARKLFKGDIEPKYVKVKFYLKNSDCDILSDEENIIQIEDDRNIVEGNYYNEFLAIQRILSFGPMFTVIEPADIKNKVIDKLKEMRKIYER